MFTAQRECDYIVSAIIRIEESMLWHSAIDCTVRHDTSLSKMFSRGSGDVATDGTFTDCHCAQTKYLTYDYIDIRETIVGTRTASSTRQHDSIILRHAV